jgi:predicted dehydrogenase
MSQPTPPDTSRLPAPTRRSVLRAGGGLLAAASLAGSASFSRGQEQQDQPAKAGVAADRRVGFAIVGIGNLSMGQILPALAKTKHCYAAALVSGSPDKAKQQAEKHGIDPKHIYSYQNYEALKDNGSVQAVYVVLPNAMHGEYTARAAKVGKHVLCEKPMEVSSARCREMIEACRAAGKKLMIAYRLRYEPNNMALIDAVGKKLCGDLKMIEAGAGFGIGDPNQWRLKHELGGGGCLMDIGVYALNASRYISREEPVEVTAVTHRTEGDPRFKDPLVEEHCNFNLRFPSGVLASCTSSYSVGTNRFRALCTNGWAEVDPGLSYQGVKFRYSARGQGRQEPDVGQVDHFAAEMDHFAQCITEGGEVRTPGEGGLKDLLAVEAIYEAAKSGRTVKVKTV